MKIEAGKYYKTRDGRKVGPAYKTDWPSKDCAWAVHSMWLYRDDGTCGSNESSDDLIAEWTDGPVRTVTRREVVEGVYGIVRVDTHRDQVVISIDPSDGHNPSAAELKAAAAVLLELAGALDD